MIAWKQQGDAVVGALTLPDGRPGRVVLVGPREHPKGAILVAALGADSEAGMTPVSEALNLLSAQQIIETLCMQERVFGSTNLQPPDFQS